MKNRILSYFLWWFNRQIRNNKNPLILALILFLLLGLSFFINNQYADHIDIAPKPSKNDETFLSCHVVKVSDGDTIRANCDGRDKTDIIRIWGVDAPELGQKPWGEHSKKHLTKLIGFDRIVNLKIKDTDQYHRLVAKLYKDNKDLGLELVKDGHAIVYSRYNNDNEYKRLEKKAKQDKLGIWSINGAQQSPEAWRRLNKR